MTKDKNYKLHTILINKNIGINNANKWILEHGYKIPKKGVHITKNYYRYRQVAPETLIKHGFTEVITKKIDKDIILVIYYKSPQNRPAPENRTI